VDVRTPRATDLGERPAYGIESILDPFQSVARAAIEWASFGLIRPITASCLIDEQVQPAEVLVNPSDRATCVVLRRDVQPEHSLISPSRPFPG
jgi:hypothetical protein